MEKQAEVTALVYQTLNSHGVLSNVRAQLRAAVFTTVIEQERKRGIEGASAGAIRGLVETTNGALAVQLMTDFMVSLGLESTLSVFRAECGLGSVPTASRDDVRRNCGLSGGSGGSEPLLIEVVTKCAGGATSEAAAAADAAAAVAPRTPSGDDAAALPEDASPAAASSASAPAAAAAAAASLVRAAARTWDVVVDEGAVSDNQSFDYVEGAEGSVHAVDLSVVSVASASAGVDDSATEDDYSMSGFDAESPAASPAHRGGGRSASAFDSAAEDDVVESGEFNDASDLSQSESLEWDGGS
jgi:hypothetical protein